ncbi:LysM domain-containing protein [Massilia sp. W12]|uniref:LysM domain-containing protein n=1 Tax=Massilia sp. W12 TaxID=3126507 RepID=UPI0030D14082
MNPFAALNSRYAQCAVQEGTDAHGRPVRWLARRFLPDPASMHTLQIHSVQQGERVDQIAAQALGDSLAWWRIMDANGLQQVQQAAAPGLRLRLTLGPGVPGPGGAQ